MHKRVKEQEPRAAEATHMVLRAVPIILDQLESRRQVTHRPVLVLAAVLRRGRLKGIG